MTPELQHLLEVAVQIAAYLVLGGSGAYVVTRARDSKKSYKELFTDATVASMEQAEELRDAKEQIKDYDALHKQHEHDMSALNGKIDLLDRQRAEQEARHTRQLVEQEARHSDQLAKVAAEKDGLRAELDRINQRVEEQARNLKTLENDNSKLRKQQQDCAQLEAERDRIAADLRRAEKRIAELEKLVDMLTRPPTPPADSAPPPVDEKPADFDGAKQATVDLPVTRDLKDVA